MQSSLASNSAGLNLLLCVPPGPIPPRFQCREDNSLMDRGSANRFNTFAPDPLNYFIATQPFRTKVNSAGGESDPAFTRKASYWTTGKQIWVRVPHGQTRWKPVSIRHSSVTGGENRAGYRSIRYGSPLSAADGETASSACTEHPT